MSFYARAYVRITSEKNKKENSVGSITWSEMGKQNVQAKGVHSLSVAPPFGLKRRKYHLSFCPSDSAPPFPNNMDQV